MSITKFAFHDRVFNIAPNCVMHDLHNKLELGLKLSNEEKQQIFDTCHEGIYKLLGWCFDFRPYMKKFIVDTYGGNLAYQYSFSKTNIRKNNYTKTGITAIYEIPNNEKEA